MPFCTTILAQVLAVNEFKMRALSFSVPAKSPAEHFFSANLTGVTPLQVENCPSTCCLLITYQLYNRIKVVRSFYRSIAELALFLFVVVDRYVGVF